MARSLRNFELIGDAELRAKLRSLSRRAPSEMGDALYVKGEEIMAESAKEVPVDQGILKKSHFVTPPKGKPEVEIGYGTDYAVYVHEDLAAHHIVGKAKYLEDPINKARSTWERDLVKILRDELGIM